MILAGGPISGIGSSPSRPHLPGRTFRATHNFLWLLDKRLRLRYV